MTYEELRARQDRMRIYIFGSDEWVEMMEDMYRAVNSCLSIEATEYADAILKMMESEAEAAEINHHDMETLEARIAEYVPHQPFTHGDSTVEPY